MVDASPQTIECEALLSHVQSAESSLPISSDAYFGHPPPPRIHLIQLPLPVDGGTSSSTSVVHLGAAVTKRCVSAQLWENNVAAVEPVDVLCLANPEADTDDEEEEISCATLLALDPAIKGSDSPICATIVVGTNFNRVISLEVMILKEDSETLSLHQGLPPFEPLPLDSPGKQLSVDDVSDHTSVHSMISDASKHGKRGANDPARSSQHGTTTKNDSCVPCSTGPAGPKTDSTKRPIAQEPAHRFCPRGGVSSIVPYRISLNEEDGLVSIVWIAYGDGTIVRVHHGSFFSFVVHHDDFCSLLARTVLRSRVLLPASAEEVTILPLPKYHPSPLAPLPAWKPPRKEKGMIDSPASTAVASDDEEGYLEDDEMEEELPEFHEALAFGGEAFPAMVFYTSENQFVGRVAGEDLRGRGDPSEQDAALLGHVIGGTSALVSGVFGTALGVVKWGLGQGGKSTEEKTQEPKDVVMLDSEEVIEQSDVDMVSPMFRALHCEQNVLLAGAEMHDEPRHITSVTVDPDGNTAATTDTLGRVLLIDLCTKQIIRMFKGFREASCAWIEIPRSNAKSARRQEKKVYLAIHSQQRRTVDIYLTRHGPRVYTMQVGRDARVIQSMMFNKHGPIACCYLLHSSAPGTALNQLEPLVFKDDIASGRSENAADTCIALRGHPSSNHEATMRLQLLQQLLAKTNVPTERQDVFDALTQITSLKDLCTALDVLAVASQLEDSMGVIGSEFHSGAVAHCRKVLDNVIREGGDDSVENAQVKQLASRIAYHSQLVEAFDVLHEFETKNHVEDEHDERVAPRSAWAVEAMAWLTMYETVTGTSVDASVIEQSRPVLPFWVFSKDCSDSNHTIAVAKGPTIFRHKIHFTDSTKSRKEILVHIFKPLLRDIFSFNVVSSIFDALGIVDDTDYLLKCFGDWFVSIRAREAARKGLFGLHSPIVRWLQDMVTCELNSFVAPDDEYSEIVLLGPLHDFCSKATDLVRAFFLATLCREAVSVATKKREAKTYGKVSSAKSVKPWSNLLRKLRVCLLVSLRLNGMDLGALPITVSNVEAEDIFSAYEWLARDELTMSHTQAEIVSLENACQGSGLVFDPSSEAGDNPNRWKMLQQACLAAAISEEEREEFLLDMNDDDQLGALLLYLSQYNSPALLAAHRALLLARQWIQKPSDLQPLNDCLDALRGLRSDGSFNALCYAVRMEVWQSAVRPFYRAVFFGFDDVHEIGEEVAGPLLDNREWLRKFGTVALPLLDMLAGVSWDDDMTTYAVEAPTENTSWPPVKEDFILRRLVQASRPACENALKVHRVIVCGTLVSEDMGALSDAVPEIFDCFMPTSLFQSSGDTMENTDKQMEFLEQAVIDRANEVQEAIPGRLDIQDIEKLSRLWNVNLRDIRTLYLLAMYELGKDTLVDESLAASAAADLDIERFVADGLGIACRRLNRILNVKRSAKTKSVMGQLDADTCEWLREQAEDSMPLLDEGDDGDSRFSLPNTHLLILRLLGLSSTVGDKTMSTKIHALSIVSGTLLKAQEQE